ncbi:MAG: AAA family ATPase [Cytophagia bacterium]|nr:AAA family ATPase [Cytophagia bacterium]
MMSRSFIHKYSNLLFSNNFIEHETGFFRNSQFLILTKHALEYFLLEENLYNGDQPTNQKDLLDYHKIPKTNLYFNPDNQEEISFLSRSLAQKQFKAIQLKLHHENLRKGINILFYGSPGTGKTELAFQLAKKHKRAIMQVDISKLKSMYYGESQKLLKNLFIRYNRLIENNSATPIMLFNEADAYLSKRLTNISSSTDQTSNALQNIILEEMEKHQGVIIATTNLTDNLDNAMERRFLFKVNFQQPNTQTKFLIWKDKLPEVEPRILKELANSYDLSGGQIENVVRKYQMNKVLGKNKADLKLMHTFCMAENYTTKTRIGFK